MKIREYRLVKKAKSSMYFSSGGYTSPDELERILYKWFLCKGIFRKKILTVPGATAQLLTKLHALAHGKVHSSEARRVQEQLVQALIAQHEVQQAWAELSEANKPALEFECTTHRHYAGHRETMQLRLGTSKSGPTPPPAGYERKKAIYTGDGWGTFRKQFSKEEDAYLRYRRDEDVSFIRPHLYREIEPFVDVIFSRYAEASNSLQAFKATAERLIAASQHIDTSEAELSLNASVSSAAAAVARLDERFISPSKEVALAIDDELEMSKKSREAGFKRWREIL